MDSAKRNLKNHFYGYNLQLFEGPNCFTIVVKVNREGYNCGGRLAIKQWGCNKFTNEVIQRIGVGYKDGQTIVLSDFIMQEQNLFPP